MDCEISFHHKFLYNSFSHLHKTHKINRLTITVRTAPNNGESTKNHPSRMIWNIFIAMRIRKNTPMIPHISIFLIISLLSFLSSHLCFSGSIHGADLYMEGPKLQGRYKLLVNLRILQFQAEQVIFINDGFPDRVIRYRIMVPAHIADSFTACSHFRSHDRFQPLDISLQLFRTGMAPLRTTVSASLSARPQYCLALARITSPSSR